MPATPYEQKTQSYQENWESLSFQSFVSTNKAILMKFYLKELSIQFKENWENPMAFHIKDFLEFFKFQGLFKGWRFFKACANHEI